MADVATVKPEVPCKTGVLPPSDTSRLEDEDSSIRKSRLVLDETEQRLTWTTKEAAERAGFSVRVIQRWAKERKIRRADNGQIDVESLRTHLKERQENPLLRGPRPEFHLYANSDEPGRVSEETALQKETPVVSRVDEQFAPASSIEVEVVLLRKLNQMLERELADAKAEKAELLSILQMWRMPPPRRRRAPSTQPESEEASEVPLWERILHYVLSAERPVRTYQVQRDLELEVNPSRELSRLVTRNLIKRISPGQFASPAYKEPDAGAC